MSSKPHSSCNMSAYSAQILLSVFGGFCCLTPLFIGLNSNIEDSKLRTAMFGKSNRDSSIVTLALTVPILIDVAVELFTSITANGNFEKLNMYLNRPLLNPLERIVFLTGTTLVASTAFLPSETPNAAYIYVCVSKCQLMLISGAILTSLCRYDKNFWSVRSIFFILILTFVASVTGVFVANHVKQSNSPVRSICTISNTFGLVAAASISFLCCRWMYITLPKLLTKTNTKSTKLMKEIADTEAIDTNSLVFTMMFVTATLVSLMLMIVFNTGHRYFEEYDGEALFRHSLAIIIYLLFVTSISTKMMKNKLIQSLVRNDTKCI